MTLELHLRTDETSSSAQSLLPTQKDDMVSITATATLITLFCSCLLVSNTSAVYHRCCRSYMTAKIPFPVIKGYSVQVVTEYCPINAIIFHTKKGKACYNPALNWVMDYINRLRNKAQMVHMKTSHVQK